MDEHSRLNHETKEKRESYWIYCILAHSSLHGIKLQKISHLGIRMFTCENIKLNSALVYKSISMYTHINSSFYLK